MSPLGIFTDVGTTWMNIHGHSLGPRIWWMARSDLKKNPPTSIAHSIRAYPALRFKTTRIFCYIWIIMTPDNYMTIPLTKWTRMNQWSLSPATVGSHFYQKSSWEVFLFITISLLPCWWPWALPPFPTGKYANSPSLHATSPFLSLASSRNPGSISLSLSLNTIFDTQITLSLYTCAQY